MTWVKLCGLRTATDVFAAVDAGAIASEHEKKKIPEAIRMARVAAVREMRARDQSP